MSNFPHIDLPDPTAVQNHVTTAVTTATTTLNNNNNKSTTTGATCKPQGHAHLHECSHVCLFGFIEAIACCINYDIGSILSCSRNCLYVLACGIPTKLLLFIMFVTVHDNGFFPFYHKTRSSGWSEVSGHALWKIHKVTMWMTWTEND